jgi:hypothetical protein
VQSNGRRDALLSLTVLAVMACAAPAAGQARAVGPRLGTFTGRESGPVSAWVVGLEAGYAFGRRLEVSGELAAWDSWGVDCLPESRTCRVGGTTLLLAVATGAGLSSNAALRLIGSVGRYDAALGSGAPAVGVGAAADLFFGSRVSLTPGARWLRVLGSDYEDVTGEPIDFRMLTLGLRVAL